MTPLSRQQAINIIRNALNTPSLSLYTDDAGKPMYQTPNGSYCVVGLLASRADCDVWDTGFKTANYQFAHMQPSLYTDDAITELEQTLGLSMSELQDLQALYDTGASDRINFENYVNALT